MVETDSRAVDRALASQLAAWAAHRGRVTEAEDALVRYRAIDYLANLLGGVGQESVNRLLRASSIRKAGPVPMPDGVPSSAAWACVVYGAAAHSLEFDDTHQGSSTHPGAVVFSTLLPLAVELGSPWTDVVRSAVIGYEVMCRIAECSGALNEYSRGFHPTGTAGVFGAAAASVALRGGSEADYVNAMGIAASFSSGSMAFLVEGAWTKHLHPGWAGMAGMLASELAIDGYQGPVRSLEPPHGYLAGRGALATDAFALALDGPLAIEETSMKAHGCCRYEQAALDALLELRSTHDLTPDAVEAVRVAVLDAGWTIVVEPVADKRRPRSVVDAQFSMPFGMAVALKHGKASIGEHSLENVEDPEVRALMDRVECFRSPELDGMYPAKWGAIVEVTCRDGRELSARVDTPKGDPENPFTADQLAAKLRDLSPTVDPGLHDGVLAAFASATDDPVKELGRLLTEYWTP